MCQLIFFKTFLLSKRMQYFKMKLTHSESKSRQQILWWLWFRLLSLRPFSSKQSLCHVFRYIFSILFETINISCFDIDLHCDVIPRQLNPHSLSSLTKYCLLKEMTQVVCISIVIGTSWQKETKRHNLCVFFKRTRIDKKSIEINDTDMRLASA